VKDFFDRDLTSRVETKYIALSPKKTVILICFVRFSPVFDHGTEHSLNKHAAGDDADGNNGRHGMSPSPAAAFDVCVRDPVTLT